jgi:hypothetical protein
MEEAQQEEAVSEAPESPAGEVRSQPSEGAARRSPHVCWDIEPQTKVVWWVRFWDWLVYGGNRKRPPLAVVLHKNRDLEVRTIRPGLIMARNGAYVPEDRGLYRNRHWLAPGEYAFYTQDDPEPIHADRVPRGYGVRFLAMLTGDYPIHTMGGGLKGRRIAINWVYVFMAGAGGLAAGYALFRYVLGG